MLLVASRIYIGFALLAFVIGLPPGFAGNFQFHAPIVFAADSTRPAGERIAPEELTSYAKAKIRVDEIVEYWSDSIGRSRSADVLREVRDGEITVALGLEGLTVERYRTIERIVENDSELRAAVDSLLRK